MMSPPPSARLGYSPPPGRESNGLLSWRGCSLDGVRIYDDLDLIHARMLGEIGGVIILRRSLAAKGGALGLSILMWSALLLRKEREEKKNKKQLCLMTANATTTQDPFETRSGEKIIDQRQTESSHCQARIRSPASGTP